MKSKAVLFEKEEVRPKSKVRKVDGIVKVRSSFNYLDISQFDVKLSEGKELIFFVALDTMCHVKSVTWMKTYNYMKIFSTFGSVWCRTLGD